MMTPVCVVTRMLNGSIEVDFDEVELIDLTMDDECEPVVGSRGSPIDLTGDDDEDDEEIFDERGMDDVETDCSSVSGSEGDDEDDDDASESIASTDTWSTYQDEDDESCERSFILYDDDQSRQSFIDVETVI